MDMNVYYKSVKEKETTMDDEYPIVVSHATGDGGVAGRLTEVTKRIAARLMVEGAARLATVLEATDFRDAKKKAKEQADQLLASAQANLAAIAAIEIERLAAKAVAAAAKE